MVSFKFSLGLVVDLVVSRRVFCYACHLIRADMMDVLLPRWGLMQQQGRICRGGWGG